MHGLKYDLQSNVDPLAERNGILAGELVAIMGDLEYSCVRLRHDNERWKLRFRPNDESVQAVSFTIYPDRRGEPVPPGHVAVTIDAELRYHLPHFDDTLAVHQQRLWEIAAPENIRIHHVGSSIIARLSDAINPDDVATEGSDALKSKLQAKIGQLTQALNGFLPPT